MIAMPVMVKLAVPAFLSVTVLAALVVPIAWAEKVRLVGDKVALGPEITAVALKVACGLAHRDRPKPSRCRSILRIFSGRTNVGLWLVSPRAAAVALSLVDSLLLGIAK